MFELFIHSRGKFISQWNYEVKADSLEQHTQFFLVSDICKIGELLYAYVNTFTSPIYIIFYSKKFWIKIVSKIFVNEIIFFIVTQLIRFKKKLVKTTVYKFFFVKLVSY